MRKLSLLLFLLIPFLCDAQVHIQGIVVDSINQEPVPFVNIAIKGTTSGGVSGLNGKFNLKLTELPVTILFSCVGYEKKEFIITSNQNSFVVHLVPSVFHLDEVTVVAGPDPGWLLMSKVLNNRDLNNPEKNCTFSYTSYNKLVFTIDADEPALDKKIDSLKNDSVKQEDFKFFKKQHLFMSESVSERQYRSPSQNKETILAAKVAGFSTPVFTLLSTQLQSFHFYKNEISLSDVKYIGPVSNLGLKHYRFIISDTFYLDKDTIYALRYFPKKEGDARSLQGVIQITTDGFAVFNVTAKPETVPQTGFTISVFQQYKKIENKQWFPVELNTTLTFPSLKIEDFAIKGVGTGNITNIKLNPEFSRKDFDEVEIALGDSIIQRSEEKLNRLRPDSLTDKEQATYHFIDSVGQKYKLDKKMQVMQSLIYGYVPVKFLDWDIGRLLSFNEYEGVRINAAFRTNYKISKWVSLGGYLGYGFNDRAWKYGSDLNIVFSRRKQIELNLLVQQDAEAASIITNFERKNLVSPYGYSEFFLTRFDSVQRYQAKFSFRALQHFRFTFFGNYQLRNACSNYSFVSSVNEYVSVLNSSYELAETGVEIRIGVNEKFIETPFGFISQGTKWPLLYLRYSKGVAGIINSSFDYDRITAKLNYTYSGLRLGTFYLSIAAGIVNGKTPYHLLFSPVGTYRPIKKLTIFSMDGFETMRPNEYLFDRIVSIHGRYRFRRPMINKAKFKPLLSLSAAMAMGNLNDATSHQNLIFSAPASPFIETGLIIDNLLKSGISGFGIGCFYRIGKLQLAQPVDNLAIKISMSLSLN